MTTCAYGSVKIVAKVGLVLSVSVAFATIFWQRIIINETSDLHIHIAYAKRIASLADITSPHFLFQLLIRAVHSVTSFSLEIVTAVVLGGCYGLMAVLVSQEVRHRSPSMSFSTVASLSFAVLIASHIFILTVAKPNLYYGYLVPTAYHNPTQQLNKLFALAIWFLYCHLFLGTRDTRRSAYQLFFLGVLCILSAIAKPSFLIAFLPISGALAAFAVFRRRWKDAYDYAIAVALPSSAVMGWQFLMTYGT